MPGSDKVQAKVYLPPDVKAMMDADKRDNSEVVESALISEYGGEKKEALARRIDELERRKAIIESERNERDRELDDIQDKLSGLHKQLENAISQKETQLNEAREGLSKIPEDRRGPDNPAVKKRAEELDMSPSELLEELDL